VVHDGEDEGRYGVDECTQLVLQLQFGGYVLTADVE
jgi:hypothetical protein